MATDWSALHGDFFNEERVLVTGGAGFIGSHVVQTLLKLGATVLVLDDLCGGLRENLEPFGRESGSRFRFVNGSILDDKLLAEISEGCRFVFHLAALGSVPRSVEQPRLYMKVNVQGTLNVLDAARAAGVERVLFSASSSAYGDTPTLPKVETMPVQARSPYAATKAACEAMMTAWACSYGVDTANLRYFNIFGPRQNANSAYAAVIAAFASALLAGQRPVIFGDGRQSRDFTYVDNAVHANLLAARCPKPLEGAVVNVACGQRVTVNELATMMGRLLGRPDLQPAYKDERAGDVKHSLADLSLARRLLGYEPIVDFAAGLEPTVAWYRETAVTVAGRAAD